MSRRSSIFSSEHGRFLLRLSAFAAGLLIIFAILSLVYGYRVRDRDFYFEQLADFDSPQNNPRVVLFGDSRVAFNFSRRELPPEIYNFGHPGEALRPLYLRAEHALREKPSIKVVVIQIDDHVLSQYRDDRYEFAKQLAFATYNDIAEAYPIDRPTWFEQYVLEKIPLLDKEQRRLLMQVMIADARHSLTGKRITRAIYLDRCNDFKHSDEGSWVKLSEKQRTDAALEQVKRKLVAVLQPHLRDVFDKFVALVKARNLKLVGIRTPMVPEFIEGGKSVDMHALHKYFAGLPFDRILDYTDIFHDRPELFTDPDHLNLAGAALLSRRLYSDIADLAGIQIGPVKKCAVYVPAATN